MPKRKQPDNSAGDNLAPSIYQVQAIDPTPWDLNTAIGAWTTLVNTSIPDLFNTINYLKGVIDGL